MVHLMKSVLWTSVLVLLPSILLPFVWSCSPPIDWRPPTLVEEILDGDRILLGRVKNTYPEDERFKTLYTVEFEVFCVLKGERTPLTINITGGGYIPGHCTSTKFDVDQDYVAILDSSLSAVRDIHATESNLLEIRKACGLNPVTRPERSTSTVACPVSIPDCESKPSDNRGGEGEDEEGYVEGLDLSYEVYDAGVAPKIKAKNNGATHSAELLAVTMATVASVVAFVAS